MNRTPEQTKEWVEGRYAVKDPWGYRATSDDADRKAKVIAACVLLAPKGGFEAALDVGAGEGWITQDLPARFRYGIELSDAAAARFPAEVTRLFTDRVQMGMKDGAFDLVVSTETMFEHYDWKAIRDVILRAARPGGFVVTANNTAWEVQALAKELGEPVLQWGFQYKGMTMSLKAWRR